MSRPADVLRIPGATALSGSAAPALISRSFGQGAAPAAVRRQLSDQERRRHHRRCCRRAAARRRARAQRPHRGGRPRSHGGRSRDDRRHRHDRHAGLRRHALPYVERTRTMLRRRRLFRIFRRRTQPRSSQRRRIVYSSVMLGSGGAGQRRHQHRAQLVAQHAHAGARRRRLARGAPRVDAARPLRLRPHRSRCRTTPIARLPGYRPREAGSISAAARRSGLVTTTASTCAACRRATVDSPQT